LAEIQIASATHDVFDHNPHPAPLKPYVEPTAYEIMFEVRAFIIVWSKDWGPTWCWPRTLPRLRQEALLTCTEDEWKCEVTEKILQGLGALGDLKRMYEVLPKDPWMVRDLWSQAFTLACEIQAGLACLQVLDTIK